jgi:hypothetical protein
MKLSLIHVTGAFRSGAILPCGVNSDAHRSPQCFPLTTDDNSEIVPIGMQSISTEQSNEARINPRRGLR